MRILFSASYGYSITRVFTVLSAFSVLTIRLKFLFSYFVSTTPPTHPTHTLLCLILSVCCVRVSLSFRVFKWVCVVSVYKSVCGIPLSDYSVNICQAYTHKARCVHNVLMTRTSLSHVIKEILCNKCMCVGSRKRPLEV